MPLSKIVQESVESFKGNFPIDYVLNDIEERGYNELKDIFFSSQIKLLEAELERKKEQQEYFYHVDDRPVMEQSGILKAIDWDITYLTEQIEECRKLV